VEKRTAQFYDRGAVFGIKTRLRQATFDVAGMVDLARLCARRPELVPSADERRSIRELLRPAYDEYVSEVSIAGMAASLETACYLMYLCRSLAPERVLDLGSGFSSYVFRRYAADAGRQVAVTSVDDDAGWLEKTRAFLRAHGCEGDDLVTWEQFGRRRPVSHGVVFHDLAGGELREAAVSFAMSQVAPGGVLVLDDAQHDGHRARMRNEAAVVAMPLFSLRGLTLDSLGRWAVLGLAASTSRCGQASAAPLPFAGRDVPV
jgi:predicted O-methyltransferase YrrM